MPQRNPWADLSDQIEDDERNDINAKIEELRTAIGGDSKEAIDTKVAELGEVTGKLAERAYAAQQAEGDDAAPTADAGDAGPSAAADDAVDAEFEEVKDDKAS